MLETLVRHALQRVGDTPYGVLALWDMLFKIKDNLLHLISPILRKEVLLLVDLFGLWKQHIPHLRLLFWLIPGDTRSFWLGGGPGQERTL